MLIKEAGAPVEHRVGDGPAAWADDVDHERLLVGGMRRIDGWQIAPGRLGEPSADERRRAVLVLIRRDAAVGPPRARVRGCQAQGRERRREGLVRQLIVESWVLQG